jgi:hypothetical protein
MQLKLTKNVVKGVYTVTGPQVPFVLADDGQANVMINVALSDGTHFHFPDGLAIKATGSTVLPPGSYDCSIMVAAFGHGAFGRTFDSSITIAGKKVASASGTLPPGVDAEDDIQSFTLKVV